MKIPPLITFMTILCLGLGGLSLGAARAIANSGKPVSALGLPTATPGMGGFTLVGELPARSPEATPWPTTEPTPDLNAIAQERLDLVAQLEKSQQAYADAMNQINQINIRKAEIDLELQKSREAEAAAQAQTSANEAAIETERSKQLALGNERAALDLKAAQIANEAKKLENDRLAILNQAKATENQRIFMGLFGAFILAVGYLAWAIAKDRRQAAQIEAQVEQPEPQAPRVWERENEGATLADITPPGDPAAFTKFVQMVFEEPTRTLAKDKWEDGGSPYTRTTYAPVYTWLSENRFIEWQEKPTKGLYPSQAGLQFFADWLLQQGLTPRPSDAEAQNQPPTAQTSDSQTSETKKRGGEEVGNG